MLEHALHQRQRPRNRRLGPEALSDLFARSHIPFVARARALVQDWSVDQEVRQAQRSIGIVLLSPADAAARGVAVEAYRRLMDRAATGDQVAIGELLRVMAEPGTLGTLQLGWADIVAVLPSPWFDRELAQRDATDLELQRLAGCLQPRPLQRAVVLERLLVRLVTARNLEELKAFVTGADAAEELMSRAFGALISAATEGREVDVLEWVCAQAPEPHRSRAFQAIGQSIAEALHLVLTSANTADWPDQANEAKRAVQAWMELAPEFRLDGDELPYLASRISELDRARVEREGATLLAELQCVWQRSIGDLREWMAHAEHLCRRADSWAAQHLAPADVRLGAQLTSAAAQVRAHARPWITAQVQLSWQHPAHLPTPQGACPYCTSWQVGPNFCRRCGSRL